MELLDILVVVGLALLYIAFFGVMLWFWLRLIWANERTAVAVEKLVETHQVDTSPKSRQELGLD